MNERITSAQNRVRFHVRDTLNAYLEDESQGITLLAKRISQDFIITSDSLACTDLYRPKFNPAYLTILRKRKESRPPSAEVCIRNYQVEGGVAGKPLTPLYLGGHNQHATFRYLFDLAHQGSLPSSGCPVYYYPGAGIIEVETNGRHRALACALWGSERLYGSTTYFCDEFSPQVYKEFTEIYSDFPKLLSNWACYMDRSTITGKCYIDDLRDFKQMMTRSRMVREEFSRLEATSFWDYISEGFSLRGIFMDVLCHLLNKKMNTSPIILRETISMFVSPKNIVEIWFYQWFGHF